MSITLDVRAPAQVPRSAVIPIRPLSNLRPSPKEVTAEGHVVAWPPLVGQTSPVVTRKDLPWHGEKGGERPERGGVPDVVHGAQEPAVGRSVVGLRTSHTDVGAAEVQGMSGHPATRLAGRDPKVFWAGGHRAVRIGRCIAYRGICPSAPSVADSPALHLFGLPTFLFFLVLPPPPPPVALSSSALEDVVASSSSASSDCGSLKQFVSRAEAALGEPAPTQMPSTWPERYLRSCWGGG